MIQINLFTKQRLTYIENKLWLPKGKGGNQLEKFEINRYKQIYNIDKQPGHTGNCIQYLVIIYNGKEYTHTHICLTESLSCIPKANTKL